MVQLRISIKNCELRVFPMLTINRFANIKVCVYYKYGTGSTIAIMGFAIWFDFTSTQLLNHTIKTSPTVPTDVGKNVCLTIFSYCFNIFLELETTDPMANVPATRAQSANMSELFSALT